MTNTAAPPEESFGGARTLGNQQQFEGLAIIAFVDLLGFSAHVKARWNSADHSSLRKLLRIKETAAAARQTTLAIDPQTAGVTPGAPQHFERASTRSRISSNRMRRPPSGTHISERFYVSSLAGSHRSKASVGIGSSRRLHGTRRNRVRPNLLDTGGYDRAGTCRRLLIGKQLRGLVADCCRPGSAEIYRADPTGIPLFKS